MKLSEMSTQQAAACMADLAAPVETIMNHPKVSEWLDSRDKNLTTTSMIGMIARFIPVFLRDYYDETVRIISALTGKSAKEISCQPIKTTIADVSSVWDEDLQDFFKSSTPTEPGEFSTV